MRGPLRTHFLRFLPPVLRRWHGTLRARQRHPGSGSDYCLDLSGEANTSTYAPLTPSFMISLDRSGCLALTRRACSRIVLPSIRLARIGRSVVREFHAHDPERCPPQSSAHGLAASEVLIGWSAAQRSALGPRSIEDRLAEPQPPRHPRTGGLLDLLGGDPRRARIGMLGEQCVLEPSDDLPTLGLIGTSFHDVYAVVAAAIAASTSEFVAVSNASRSSCPWWVDDLVRGS